MKKIAFLFPGQGSQYVGMGKDFYEKYDSAKAVIDKAGEISGWDIKHLLFEENEEIMITKYTQLLMLADELAILQVLREKGIEADVTAGLSLGEYAAVVASGALSIEDAFKVIIKRGLYMQEAYPTGGAMSAIMNMDNELIEKLCEETEGIVNIANYNCPGQTVITGEEKAVAEVGKKLIDNGCKKVTPLKVSGPFHSALLKEAGEKLRKELDEVTFNPIKIPYITNVTADYVNDSAEIKDLLVDQISNSVRWQQSCEKMIADGVDVFIEIGPKKSLTGFLKKIDKETERYHIDTVEQLDEVLEALKEA